MKLQEKDHLLTTKRSVARQFPEKEEEGKFFASASKMSGKFCYSIYMILQEDSTERQVQRDTGFQKCR